MNMASVDEIARNVRVETTKTGYRAWLGSYIYFNYSDSVKSVGRLVNNVPESVLEVMSHTVEAVFDVPDDALCTSMGQKTRASYIKKELSALLNPEASA